MAGSPQAALDQFRGDARSGRLAQLCHEAGIELLVAFGSATDPEWPVAPRDLDLTVALTVGSDLLRALNVLMTHLGSEQIDVMDLGRAGNVARAQALSRGSCCTNGLPARSPSSRLLP